MMYELVKVAVNTYYIDCPAKIGLYNYEGNKVCLFDSGNDKNAGRKVQRIIEENGWKLTTIYNTHSHADHCGGNAFLQEHLGCEIFLPEFEAYIANHTLLAPGYLYGGHPFKKLKNKFLMAQPCQAQVLTEDSLLPGISMVRLDGHTSAMAAYKTADEVWFVGDSVISGEIVEKYKICFLCRVDQHLESLDKLEQLQGSLFIPSHAQPVGDIKSLVQKNKNAVHEVLKEIIKICMVPLCIDDVIKQVFDNFNVAMDINQYVIVGSTIRSYLSYLYDLNKLNYIVEDNKILFVTI